MGESEKKIENIENELPIKTKKASKEIREKIYTKLFKNLCIAILICLYFIFINLGFKRLDSTVFENDLHIFAAILIVSTIMVFEKAYKNNDNEITVYGIELLMVSIVTLFMPYIYFRRGNTLKTVYALFEAYITVYYLLKCFIIYKVEMKKNLLEMSDIKDIVEDDKSESYLDEKNKRKFEADEVESKNIVEKDDVKKEEMRKDKMKSILNLLKKKKKKDAEIHDEFQLENEPFSEEMLESFYTTANNEKIQNAEKKKEIKSETTTEYSKGKPKKKRGRKPVNKKLVKSIATETRRRKKDNN